MIDDLTCLQARNVVSETGGVSKKERSETERERESAIQITSKNLSHRHSRKETRK